MPGTLATALINKLRTSNDLDSEDIAAIEKLPIEGKHFAGQQRIVSDGDRPSQSCLVIDGFAYRSKNTDDGQRQILSIHVPGEMPDLQTLHLHVMDHDLTTLTECILGLVPHESLRELTRRRPKVGAALWRETLIDAAIFREWLVNIGRRSALVGMAHLLAELRQRLELVGRTRDGVFELPITQTELGDCLGVSSVHVNRVLQQLRKDGIIALEKKSVHVLDKRRLEELGQFDRLYLHQSPTE